MRKFYLLWSTFLLLPFSLFAQSYTAEELDEIDQAQYEAMMGLTIQSQNFGGFEYGNDGINEDFIPTAGATETFNPAVGDFFYDPGGPGGSSTSGTPGNYPNCGCITNTTLAGVNEIQFNFFSVFGTFDWLRIYDGIDNTGTVLYDNGEDGANEGDITLNDMIASHGSAIFTSTSGNFFFEFRSSTVVDYGGWEVEITGGGEPGGGNCELDGDTTDGEIWDRPLADGSGMSGAGVDVRYKVYGPFTVDTAGDYTVNSVQDGGWDGFIFVYQDVFDPTDPLTNFVAGDDDGPGGIGTSEAVASLVTGTEYFIITTGFDDEEFGPYTTTITGPGTYTCDGGSEPGGECEQGIPSADEIFEGYNITLGNAFRSAEDFTVDAGTMFTLETITVDVNNITSPNEATILIREDNAGIPGAILHTISGGPDDSEVVGTGFGEPVYHLTFNLDTPIELTEGIYWIDPKMSATTGETIWWATIEDFSHGSDPYRSNDDGATWTADVGASSIFTVSGTCEDDVPPGDNDECDGAIAVSCGDSVSGTTSDATDSGANPAPDRFYSFTGNGETQLVTVSLCGSSYDTYVRIFSDCTLTNEINGNDDFCGLQSQVTFESDGTSTYVIMVEGYSSNSGDYTMAVTCTTPPVVEEPDYPCFQGDGLESNNFENGYNVTAGSVYRNADDFIVDDVFTIQYLRMNIFMNPGATATSVTFNIRADDGGAPSESNIVDSFTATPTNQGVLGTNFGFDISQVEFVLDADRPELPAGTYWLQPEVSVSDAGPAYWEVTSTGSLGSYVHTSEAGGSWNSDPENMQAVFFVAGVCGDTQPVDCNQEVLSNALENGSFLGGDTDQRLAIDLTVDADTQMTIAAIEPTIIIPEGGQATTFSFIFYEDNAGLPGAEVANVDGTITSSTVTGQNFGRDFIRYAVDLNTPVILDAGTYWMEMTSDAEGWETTTASVIGSPLIFNSTTTSGEWIVTSSGAELVYEIVATCETLGVSDMDAFDFAYYPNPVKDVLNINSKKQVENIAVFNLAGQQVLVKSQIANGQINVASLPTGVYIFKATLQGGQVETFKIVKK
ncbi:T9SS type A sorting domain-containing protein [Moheibacter lacus]|uniref:T9SS type A sorting domain-containing protein n=1 Tax=Moheibacter lacus TaxID=2745851 RepID=A0A838ZTD3_9FLAO|nr:T9SS type A sorting domain-containing protein [Moheibacter lacus]MBA5630250.1 T9SS type A sorting domain-containing protein [Moheibacter lacus]